MPVSASHLCILSLVLFAGGCASMARRLEVPAVAKIKTGSTTIAEVEEMFGRPNETVAGSGNKTVARYFFRELHMSHDVSPYERHEHPGDILFRTLSLRYGPGPVIEQKLHDESLTPIHQYNGWYAAGPAVAAENLVFIHRHKTTAAELVEHLGEPTSRTFDTDGTEMLIWFIVKARRDRLADAEVRRLIVQLTDQHVVKDYAVVTHDLPSVSGNFR